MMVADTTVASLCRRLDDDGVQVQCVRIGRTHDVHLDAWPVPEMLNGDHCGADGRCVSHADAAHELWRWPAASADGARGLRSQ
jgi:hypothetical protein